MININPDKIKEVICRGGEIITKIIFKYSSEGVKTVSDKDDVKVDLKDDGSIVIVNHTNKEVIRRTIESIENIVREFEDGKIYIISKVVKVEDFGCFEFYGTFVND